MPGDNLKLSIGVIVGSLLLIGGIVVIASALDKPEQVDVQETIGKVAAISIKGNPEAETAIVEFSDFQCPACAAASSKVKQFVADYSDQVKFIYRHIPLSQHQNARLAAYAAEAAGEQEKFWEVHDWLFANQNLWSEAEVSADYFFGHFGELFELDQDQFGKDYQSSAVRDRVSQDATDAKRLGVTATPTFFINGQKYTGVLNYQRLVELTNVTAENSQ